MVDKCEPPPPLGVVTIVRQGKQIQLKEEKQVKKKKIENNENQQFKKYDDQLIQKQEEIDEVENNVMPEIKKRQEVVRVKTPNKKGKSTTKDVARKSNREKKTPLYLVNSVTDPLYLVNNITDLNAVGGTLQRKISKINSATSATPSQQTPVVTKVISKPRITFRQSIYPNFKCDHCGSRYVVNPMRRGNQISSSARYKASPRHKIDPLTQKILTLCNACGLKFGRPKKTIERKEEISGEEQKKFFEEGQLFAKELSQKLSNEAAANLFCSNAKKLRCGCIQKYIYGTEGCSHDEILERANDLLDIYLKAIELRKQKCYDSDVLDIKPGRKNALKIGLGNGHRKSKEFEEFVLTKRKLLRTSLKFCEKGAQKILSYSNNFLHKRMKTDPQKGIRIERQKGKAALGMLDPIEDLILNPCCIDNCVTMALTHGRLLEVWRERAISSQVEARRVLAEMLTPSGGNRANCYRFVSWVTGCSHSTIGKVNEQMKNTGGDREPPEHGLKKYWKDNPKNKKEMQPQLQLLGQPKYVPSYQILQTAANSAGLSTIMQDLPPPKTTEPEVKKTRRQPNKTSKGKSKKVSHSSNNDGRLSNMVSIVTDSGNHVTATNLQNMQATVIALNAGYPNGGFISIPTGLTTGNTITIPNAVSLHTMQQQVQQQQQHHQQQLQLQIEILQQQLQNNQAGNIPQGNIPQHSLASVDDSSEYVVTVSNEIEQKNNVSVGTPVVVETVTTQNLNVATQPYVPNVVTQALVSNIGNSEQSVLPTAIVANSSGNISFVSPVENMSILQNTDAVRNGQNISLLTSSLSIPEELNIITKNNAAVNFLTPQNTLTETSVIGMRAPPPIENLRQVHLITSQSPTMALSQPVTLSLQSPTISLSNLPTMLLAQSPSNEQRQQTHQQQFIIQQASSTPEQVVFQRPLFSQPNTEHLVVQQTMQTIPTMHSSTEQTVAITSSVLPPMTSFNADAFLTSNGTTTYAVLNTGAQIHSQHGIDDQSRQLEQTSIQMPFMPS